MLEVKKALKGFVFLTVVFALLIVGPLSAQEEADTDQTEKSEKQEKIDRLFKMSLEELMDVRITTAGKTSQRIGDIPASVVLITREDIETYGYQTLTEILENIPGLYGIDDYAEYGTNFGVRGFWSGVSNDNMIILVNDVHHVNDYYTNYPMNKIILPVEAIDRIEVIRGPMSVVYGAGAFYGVINIITNEETNKPLSMISGSYGTMDTKKLFLRVSGNEGDLKYFFNSSIYSTNGIDVLVEDMVTDPTALWALGVPPGDRTKDKMDDNQKYFNFSGTFKGFSVNMTQSETEKKFYFALPPVDRGSEDRITATHLSFGYKGALSKTLEVEGKLSYSRIRDSYKYDHLFRGFYGIQDVGTNAWEVELNSFFKPSPKFDITVGLHYRAVTEATNMFDLPSFGNPFFENNQVLLAEDDDIVTQAIFTQIDYRPFKKLLFVAGIRFEQTPAYELRKLQTFGSNPVVETRATFDRNEIDFIPRLAAIYYINDKNILKFLYGQAINRPSFAQNYQNTLLSDRDPLTPEMIQTLELNYISTLSSRFSLNTSIFLNTLDKLITRVVKFDEEQNYESYSDNAGKMVTHGIELTLNAEPIEYLRMELSGIYQNTEDKRVGLENIDVAYSPKFLGYLKASYLGVGFKAAVTGTYVGAMETFWDQTIENPDGTLGNRIGEKVDGYFLLGANLRFDDLFKDGLYLNIRCSNLFDTGFRYPTFTNNDWATAGTIGMGRTFLVTLGYKF